MLLKSLICGFLLLSTFHQSHSTPVRLQLKEINTDIRTNINPGNVADSAKARAAKFLQKFDVQAKQLQVESGEANWNYETDLTDDHLKQVVEVGERLSSFYLNASVDARLIKSLDLPTNLSRQVSLIARSASPTEKELRVEIATLVGNMTKLYGAATVRQQLANGTVLKLTNSDMSEIFVKSRNRTLLDWAWLEWRNAVGPPMKSNFASLMDYLNIAAREHSWIDYGSFLRSDYEMSDLEEILDEVWKQVEPLYQELHAYVRFKLTSIYNINTTSCIPASLLGDTFAQNWENIFDVVKPTKDSKAFDVTKELVKQNYTVDKIFRLAESFFTSIGLDAMPESFWNRSVLVKPKDKEMVCHASAWDVSKDDVRIKMCTRINQKDLTTVHHEMGHIEYFLAYRNQPTIFRAGANPGFHEAIGDTISLSVETPSYLKRVGLMNHTDLNPDDEISFLLNQALRRIAPIPYNLIVDKWRWKIYEGVISEENYNKAWWDLRKKYQGVEPPVPRPSSAFDPGSKYHIGANVPYIPYFISYILQFQLHSKLCKLADHKGKLYQCSIFNSTNAGKEFKKLLSAGRSQPWPKLLKMFSGEQTLKADAILEYFAPLKEWLIKQRKEHKYGIGWPSMTKMLQEEPHKLEAGQERSEITKVDNNDDKATLSFNIPPDALKDLLKNYPDIKHQYENTSNSSNPLENATNPTDSQMAAGNNKQQSTSPKTQQALNLSDLSKLLTDQAAAQPNKPLPQSPGVSLENTTKTDPSASNNQTLNVDKSLLVNTLQNLLQNNVSLVNQDKKVSENQVATQNNQKSNTDLDSLPVSSLPPSLLSALTNPSPSNNTAHPDIANLLNDNSTKANMTNSAVNLSSTNANNRPAESLPIISKDAQNSAANQANPVPPTDSLLKDPANTNLIDEASKLSKEELLGVLKGVLSAKQNSVQTGNSVTAQVLSSNNNNSEDKPIYDYLNLPGNSSSNQPPSQSASQQEPSNDDITKGLKKLLGITDKQVAGDKINTTTFNPDGSKFSKLVETCVRSSDDPKCMHGKIVNEGGYVPKRKNGVDDSKQTISISPSTLVQKLMEHKQAEDSTPAAVENSPQPPEGNPVKNIEQKGSSPDHDRLISLLQNALSSKAITTRQDVATNHNSNKTMCNKLMKRQINKLLTKRGFLIKYNCNGMLSNYTHVGLTGKSPVSTSDLLKSLIKENLEPSRSLPPTHLQKTSNGFQVDFDLHVKDQIPKEVVSGTLKTLANGRQQHINLYQTPNGVAMKPKSSVQLLKPQFVPVAQNRDNIELGKTEKKSM